MILLASILLVTLLHSFLNRYLCTLLSHVFLSQTSLLKSKLIAAKTTLSQTSAQDQFAKWAKLRRTHDKLLEEYTRSVAAEKDKKRALVQYCSWVVYALVYGTQVLLDIYTDDRYNCLMLMALLCLLLVV